MPLSTFSYVPHQTVPKVVLKTPVVFRLQDIMEIDHTGFDNILAIKTALEHCPVIRCIWIRHQTALDDSYSLALNLKSSFDLEDFTHQLSFWLHKNF